MIARVDMVIRAPVAVVWRALTEPALVVGWAGVRPARLRPDYPSPGEHALWWDRGTLLHDVIVRVEPERRLTSRLSLGPWTVVEEYELRPAGASATRLLATWRGHPRLALGNDELMRRFKKQTE